MGAREIGVGGLLIQEASWSRQEQRKRLHKREEVRRSHWSAVRQASSKLCRRFTSMAPSARPLDQIRSGRQEHQHELLRA